LETDKMLNQDMMREATRLTRSGQFAEAAELLQRMFRSGRAPDQTSRAGHSVRPERTPPIIDAEAYAEVTDAPRPARQTPAQAKLFRELLKRTKDSSGFGLRGVVKRAPPTMAEMAPQGARFIEGTYSNAAGSRAYRLFIPTGYQGQPLPLLVMLHGCTQSAEDFAAGTRMNFMGEERSCFVVYPAQPREANQAKCWNWFRADDQQRGRGEPSLIAGITRQIMRDYAVDPERVYVGGLSAGAAAAVVMGATYSDLYAAIGVHSGLACGAATDLPSAFVAMRQGGANGPAIAGDGPPLPTIVFHGDRDATVHPGNGDQVLEQSMKATRTNKKVHRGQVPGGHAYTRTVHTDANGRGILEHWDIHGAGHAWSGGSPAGSYTDPQGPDATREMLRFFLEHRLSQDS
jgi:poly(hydroxyalkanoate) depolymerase family esterase